MTQVLNIPVSARLLRTWDSLFVPATQPFYLPDTWSKEAWAAPLAQWPLWKREELHAYHLPMHVLDTLNLYELAPEATWALLLDVQGFGALPEATRTGLLELQTGLKRGGVRCSESGKPFVWWPETWLAQRPEARWQVLKTFMEDDRLPCRRRELTPAHRRELKRRFPHLLPLLGTFAAQSGPNCLGTVMAACGVPGAKDLWMHAPPFLRWLDLATVPTDDLAQLGTVLVWRDGAGTVQHAALALGEGWLFHKEAQGWFAPRQVVRAAEGMARWQQGGWTVSGHRLS